MAAAIERLAISRPPVRLSAQHLRRILVHLADAALELVLPRACVTCDALQPPTTRALVCTACWTRLGRLPNPQCERCGHPLGVGSCRWCPLLPPFVRAARSVCWVPGGVAERIVYALKYDGWRALGAEIGERLARVSWPDDVRLERTALIPVPLSAHRLRERGYNQSSLLAAPLSLAYGIPVWDDVVQRAKTTVTQTRLTPEQRLYNVAGAFQVVSGTRARLRGSHVILVDDVVTTAATLNECAAALWSGGARVVSYVTFGRARSAGDAPLTRG